MAKHGILKPGSIPLSIKYIYPERWEGIKLFLGTKAVPYETFINFLIENDITKLKQLRSYLNTNPQKGIKRYPGKYYPEWPGWVGFRKGITIQTERDK